MDLLKKGERGNENKECEKITALYEADPMNVQNALNYLLHGVLHGMLETEDRVEGGHIWCPEWQMTLTPEIVQLTEQSVVVNFHLSAPQWGQKLFECCAAMGDTPKNALGMAVGTFLFSFMQGVSQMERGEEPHEQLETHFSGHSHRWNVYRSNIVGIGNSPKTEDAMIYWNMLKDEIAKRLGNQKLCYVKVFGAKSYGNVTGECRINDSKSEELSKLVSQFVEQWDVEGFASHKQFFFLKQDEKTVCPYPYWGEDGREKLKAAVRTAAEQFHACETQEQYENLPKRLKQELKDATLAAECYSFLPEICAENAFNQVRYPETIEIQVGNNPSVTVWKTQLADYWTIHNVLFELFQEGAFGEATNAIYREYISMSATYSVIQKMMNSGKDIKLEDAKMVTLLYQENDGFEIR